VIDWRTGFEISFSVFYLLGIAFATGEEALASRHVESALDEMLFSGGSLNAKLLGFTRP
jgi:hypothetical protein